MRSIPKKIFTSFSFFAQKFDDLKGLPLPLDARPSRRSMSQISHCPFNFTLFLFLRLTLPFLWSAIHPWLIFNSGWTVRAHVLPSFSLPFCLFLGGVTRSSVVFRAAFWVEYPLKVILGDMDINSGEPAPSTSSERKRKYPAGMESPSADPQPTNCLQADFSEDYVISMGTLNQINEINMQNNPLHNTYK